jgi:hypothetical protein
MNSVTPQWHEWARALLLPTQFLIDGRHVAAMRTAVRVVVSVVAVAMLFQAEPVSATFHAEVIDEV